MTASLLSSDAKDFTELWRDYWESEWHHLPRWRDKERLNSFLTADAGRWGEKPLVYDYPEGKRPFIGVLSHGKDALPSSRSGVLEFPDAGHLLTIAPTRTGKGTSQIIPNLLFYSGSCLVVDIKGENHDITAEHRAQIFEGAKVIKFAPFEDDTARYNPLDFIRTAPLGGSCPDTFDDARLVSEMLLPSKGRKDEYWDIESRNLLTALLLYIVCQHRVGSSKRTIRAVVDILYTEPDLENNTSGIESLIPKLMVYGQTENYRPLVALATGLLEHEEKVRNSIVSTCRAGMQIWLSERLTNATSRSDFHFSDLKSSMCRPLDENPAPTTIYVSIPPEYLNEYRSVVRMMTGLAAVELTRPPSWNKDGWQKEPPCPVLFLLDEFPALGHMGPIVNGLAYLAGYGVQIWTFAQNIGQLKEIYGDSWQNFPANAGATSFFGVNDPDTAEYVERLLGETEEYLDHYVAKADVTVGSSGSSTSYSGTFGGGSGSSSNYNIEEVKDRLYHRFAKKKIASAADIRALPEELQLVFIRNKPPILATKLPHYQFELLEGLYSTWKR